MAAAAAACAALPRAARSEPYPARPVRIIVGFAPGGPTDLLARMMGQWLSERLGQQFVVENRPGASGNIATQAVVNAPADGYTLLLVAPANTINASLYDRLGFDFLRDIAPVAGIMRSLYVMEVSPSFPARTVPEFIAYAEAHPGTINMASAGSGTPQHVAGEMFKLMTGVQMTHVPYRGAVPALTDLIGGRVQVMFDNMASSLEHIRAGTLRPLAVTTRTRFEVLPDVPTVNDFVPGFEASAQFGIGAPMRTPGAVVNTLNREINAALADPVIKARLSELAGAVLTGAPADYGRVLADETEKWAKVVRAGNIKPD